jgi:hypothetical protein
MRSWLVLLMVVGCGSPSSGIIPEPDAAPNTTRLGMNDVTMLLPLPSNPATATLLKMSDGGDLVPRTLFKRLVTDPNDVANVYEEFHVVAIRFDLCDRLDPGPCPAGADGRVRIVFQPLVAGAAQTEAMDVALHAFYPIPSAELPSVIDELRVLAHIACVPTTSPLTISPALIGSYYPEYTSKLRALVLRYASAARLTRLTLFAQISMAASLNWIFRGVELADPSFADISIPGIQVPLQRAILVGSDPSYSVMPVVDAPQGFTTALDSQTFLAANTAGRQQALSALADTQNPMKHSAQTEQCVACHVSTYLLAHRAGIAGIDPATISGSYTSGYDVSVVGGMSATNERSLRALGWLFDKPAISQRVANDTAQVLTEIDQRFPN